MSKTKIERGVTLVELMVVIVIIAVLSVFAIPSYKGYVMRAQRGDARVALMRVAQFMERAATANGRYPLTADVPASVLVVEGGRYDNVVVVSNNGLTFTATANRKAGTMQEDDKCGNFSINQAGVRDITSEAAGMTADNCWRR